MQGWELSGTQEQNEVGALILQLIYAALHQGNDVPPSDSNRGAIPQPGVKHVIVRIRCQFGNLRIGQIVQRSRLPNIRALGRNGSIWGITSSRGDWPMVTRPNRGFLDPSITSSLPSTSPGSAGAP